MTFRLASFALAALFLATLNGPAHAQATAQTQATTQTQTQATIQAQATGQSQATTPAEAQTVTPVHGVMPYQELSREVPPPGGNTIARSKSWCQSLLNKCGLACWTHHTMLGCGSLHSELGFAFGSCRYFYGERCIPQPPHSDRDPYWRNPCYIYGSGGFRNPNFGTGGYGYGDGSGDANGNGNGGCGNGGYGAYGYGRYGNGFGRYNGGCSSCDR